MIEEIGIGSTLLPFEVDTCSWESVKALAEEVKNRLESLDVLIYSAGITKTLKFKDNNTWKKTLLINLYGLFYSMKAFHQQIKPGGSIIIIESGSAITGSGGAFGIMRSLVLDLGGKGININVVSPKGSSNRIC
jgi:3-oxoacyl-[acyl-carrier protein] reductase